MTLIPWRFSGKRLTESERFLSLRPSAIQGEFQLNRFRQFRRNWGTDKQTDYTKASYCFRGSMKEQGPEEFSTVGRFDN